MARRNGRGSKSLAETIAQFERSELRLLRSASKAQILTAREAERLEERFSDSPSQKRSSDVLSAAIHLNKLLTGALREAPNGERATPRTEVEVLAEMAAALRAEAEVADSLLGLLNLLRELVPFDRAGVFVLDCQQKRLELIASAGGGAVDLIEAVEFDLGTGFSSWVAKRRKPTLLTDLQRPVREGEMPLRCFMSVPVIVHGDLVGVLNLGHSLPRAFDEDHLRLVSTVTSLLAATLTREVMERMLAENAAVDPRTGVLTAKQLARRALEETDRSRRHGDPLTLVLVRVEGYEALVSAHGFGAGEAVIRDLGRLLPTCVRSADPVGQVGTDEFALLLVHTGMMEAQTVAGRVVEQVAKHSFPRRRRLKVACAATAFPEGGEDLAELVTTARRRLGTGAGLPPNPKPHHAGNGKGDGSALPPKFLPPQPPAPDSPPPGAAPPPTVPRF
jgi:diguanylate cyclase (GGDEF)-like protein